MQEIDIDEQMMEEEKAGEKQEQPVEEEPKNQPKVWDEGKNPLKDDEELEFDSSAYVTLHRSKVEWPCLSLDVMARDRCVPHKKWFN